MCFICGRTGQIEKKNRDKTAPEPNGSKEKLKVKYVLDLCYENVLEYGKQEFELESANETVKSITKEGYKIPFITTPEKVIFKNNLSAQNHREFVDEALNELLATGRVPYVVNPLSVSIQRNGKKRLILDLRHVNKHVYKDKIKFDDWKTMEDFVVKQGFLFKFDIKQGYHHI